MSIMKRIFAKITDTSKREDKERLVDPDELRHIIDGIKDLEPYKDFLKGRWLKMVMWWHNRSVEARKKYFWLRRVVIVGSVLIPVLSALNMNAMFAFYGPISIAVVGAIVAGCVAWEGVANYGETWREKRRAAELLKVEGWQFFQLCGNYQDSPGHKDAFPRFAAAVENMIAKEVGQYLAGFDSSLAQSKFMGEKRMAVFEKRMNDMEVRQQPAPDEAAAGRPVAALADARGIR